jgi:hypothetical protein
MKVRVRLLLGVSAVVICFTAIAIPCIAFSQDVQAGVDWLKSNQNDNGSWGENYEGLVLDYESSFQAVCALSATGDTGSEYQSGLDWFRLSSFYSAAEVARQLEALATAGNPIDSSRISGLTDTLVSWQNSDGGFGAYSFCSSGNVFPGMVLEALGVTDYSNTDRLSAALGFLEDTQDTSGGWTLVELDSTPSAFATATALLGIASFADASGVAQMLSDGRSWLGKHQNAGGGFGRDSSTVYETALAALALAGTGEVSISLDSAMIFLSEAQDTNGSWSNSAHETGLAIRFAPSMAFDKWPISFPCVGP